MGGKEEDAPKAADRGGTIHGPKSTQATAMELLAFITAAARPPGM
jgi:hypothetical protein